MLKYWVCRPWCVVTMYISRYGMLPVIMILPCEREVGNPHDPSTIAVKKGTVVVVHVPRKI